MQEAETRPLIGLVDDDPVTLRVLTRALEPDYRTFEARNGTEGMEKIEALRPDLVLLDVDMPDLDGFEVCRKLRSDSNTENVPVIFVTSLASKEDEERGFVAGGDDYITKPVAPAIIRARVDRLIQVSHYITFLEAALEDRATSLATLRKRVTGLLRNKEEAEITDVPGERRKHPAATPGADPSDER